MISSQVSWCFYVQLVKPYEGGFMAGLPVKLETIEGPPIQVGDRKITPVSQALTFRINLPLYQTALVYNRPSAVLVQQGSGPAQKMPIVDVTRLAWLALMGVGFLFMLVFRRK